MGLRVWREPTMAAPTPSVTSSAANSTTTRTITQERSSMSVPRTVQIPRTIVTATEARPQAEQEHAVCDPARFASQCYNHIILSTSAQSAPLALRMGLLLAATNRDLIIGVIASPLTPRALSTLDPALSTSVPTNIRVLSDPSISPKLMCAGTQSKVIGVQLNSQHIVGVQREAVVCCHPTDSAEEIAALLDNAFAAVSRPGNGPGPGRGLTAGVKDLRIAPVRTFNEADTIARWVTEAWVMDERK